eukprot:1698329-Pleurochrysis_carterae.AAC.4
MSSRQLTLVRACSSRPKHRVWPFATDLPSTTAAVTSWAARRRRVAVQPAAPPAAPPARARARARAHAGPAGGG